MADLVSIVIPAFNQLDYCRQCISSLRAFTRPPYKLILVDNGSTDGVSEYFDSVPGACVVHSGKNLGFAGGINLGLEHAEGHVLLLNSDTITPRGWLERLEGALFSSDEIGMVGPMSNSVSGSQLMDGLELTSMDGINAFAQDLAERKRGCTRDVARLVGFCLLIRDTAFRRLGPLDEAYGIGNYEDDDYCVRALRAGYRLCIAEDAFVFHYGGRTFAGMGLTGEKWTELIAENERRFQEKWDLTVTDRSDAAQQSRQLNREAREAAAREDWVGATDLLRRAIQVFPLLETNYNDLGAVLWQLGEADRAIGYFMHALRINRSYTEARDNLRDAAKALGRLDEFDDFLE